MALNIPLLAAEGEPVALPGEYFLLMRRDISCSVHVAGSNKLKSKGVVYLSTKRIVFVAIPAARSRFQSFEAPLTSISGEKFNQPIFGANNLSGVATTNRLPHPAKFKITFNAGGVGTFLRLFFPMMERVHAANEAQRQAFFNQVENGKFVRSQQAYFDPSDPSVVYVTQPAFAKATPPANAGGDNRKGGAGTGGGAAASTASPVPTASYVAAPAPAPAPAPRSGGTYGSAPPGAGDGAGAGATPPAASAPPYSSGYATAAATPVAAVATPTGGAYAPTSAPQATYVPSAYGSATYGAPSGSAYGSAPPGNTSYSQYNGKPTTL